jgi:hypothetical protein
VWLNTHHHPSKEDLEMAYMDQTKKTRIAAALKAVMPKDWKYSLAVRNHMSIVLTIQSAPEDLLAAFDGHYQVNTYHYDSALERNGRADLVPVFSAIMGALNLDNHDNSDIQVDYFDVGHYVDVNVGRWNKPFICTTKVAA